MADIRNDQLDPKEVEEFWTALGSMKASRRHKKPVSPASVLRAIMAAQGKRPEDVAELTGVPIRQVDDLLKGELRFTGTAVSKFQSWLGDSAETLHRLQHLCDAFDKNGQRPDRPMPDEPEQKPDPRTIRMFASRKPGFGFQNDRSAT